jgi:small-conductance mechanosensitive channel
VLQAIAGRIIRTFRGYMARRTSAADELRRIDTVGTAFRYFATVIVVLVAGTLVLGELGISVAPILATAGVAGVAIGFGAQSLIKDYFTGFLVLLEQQYMIGDVVKIGAITGTVEKITLRLTVVRDMEGSVHFIPHGQITLVSNLTHGWSQALFDLQVSSSETVERVRDLFFELVRELRSDPEFGPWVLDDPELLGVDTLGDATFTIKFALRTHAQKRLQVRRELLRRIKRRFADEKIKVSVPA